METAANYIEYIDRLPGVISSDVVLDGDRISEIHVLSNGTRMPKQIVRDVQSIFYARFHTSIDHKVVSVAQINMPAVGNLAAEAAASEALETTTEPEVAKPSPRLMIEELSLSKRANSTEVRVVLSLGGRSFSCAQTCGGEKTEYCRAISQATLGAVCEALDNAFNFTVLDSRMIEIAGETVMIVCALLLTAASGWRSITGLAV